MNKQKPDTSRIYSQLKDFQRDTVEYVFRRMYLDEDFTPRFLVADEVGLGKTLVARGLTAKVIDHLWPEIDKIKRIDIVYICSNADIARQNINRLNITPNKDFVHASRLTLLPIMLQGMKKKNLNFVSFTPSTSFDAKSGTGISDERILLYWMLHEPWQLTGRGPMNVLQMDVVHTDRWRHRIQTFGKEAVIDDELRTRFARHIRKRKDLQQRFHELSEVYSNKNHRETRDERDKRTSLIGALRHELAVACLNALEPDFIIMDEFQRFRHLLDAEGEESELARELFDYSDAHTTARVLLLSATPYKMYTMNHEAAQEDHHNDFLHTYRFLSNSEDETARFRDLLQRYRDGLFRIGEGGLETLLAHKREVERLLRRYIVRTERLAVRADRNGMLRQLPPPDGVIDARDIRAYTAFDGVARVLDQGDVMEFWKSAPYLLNFMDSYIIKQKFSEGMRMDETRARLENALRLSRDATITQADIRRYRGIDPANARLRGLLRDVIDNGAWKLLWLPAARPYYQPPKRSVYSQPGIGKFTKRLVFSAWHVVPKVIATLVSYEAERLMSRHGDPDLVNTAVERKKRRPLLRFARSLGRNTGMPVLGILYPCETFATRLDPLKLRGEGEDSVITSEEILRKVEYVVHTLLTSLPHEDVNTGADDDDWYWAAPMLIDLQHAESATRAWLEQPALVREWVGENSDDASEDDSAWSDHVEEMRGSVAAIQRGERTLGRRPSDLPRILALQALAGPGVTSLRALRRILPEPSGADETEITESKIRNVAGQVAWSFLSLFNTPESISLLRGIASSGPYWQRVLEYAFDGNLQAVLDEYVHFLHDAEGWMGKSVGMILAELPRKVIPVISMRTSRLTVDDVRKVEDRGFGKLENFGRIRYALRLQEEQADAVVGGRQKGIFGAGKTRQTVVQDAFNSPFHPFVLASTSIGQEGLDFHAYCHAVVHWNLPGNPVDLEQREGRVHRYKGHAVRKNIAARYGHLPLDGARDIWRTMFDRAHADRGDTNNDLVPYWLYPTDGGAVIERHVPHLPLSRDQERLIALRRSLAIYRMVFGQSRQEDMIAYLLRTVPEENQEELMKEIVIDLGVGNTIPDGETK